MKKVKAVKVPRKWFFHLQKKITGELNKLKLTKHGCCMYQLVTGTRVIEGYLVIDEAGIFKHIEATMIKKDSGNELSIREVILLSTTK